MATKTTPSSSSISKVIPVQETIPSNSHNHTKNSLITIYKLTGQNYIQLSQFISVYIHGKGKDEYILADAMAPTKKI